MAPGRTVTTLFTDLVGSTALSERLGDDAAQALRRAHDRISRAQFERFGGRIVKGTGDGFLVAFDSARQGVECAVEVQRAIAAEHAQGRYLELRVRAGLHTGEPVAEGDDLLGNDVNLAARITAEAAAGQVLVSEVTRLLARLSPGLRLESIGTRNLKGFAEPVDLFEVRWPEGSVTKITRFVGRQEEVACLRQCLAEAVQHKGSVALVAGEPGLGKTRLVSEIAIEAADRGFQVLNGRAYETEGMPPYLPFSEALSPYVRDRSPQELAEVLGATAPYVAKLLPQLYQLLPDIPELPSLDPEAERYRLFEGVTEFVLRLTAKAPLFLFLDDLHWADEATLLLLQHLARHVPEAPLLIVATYRDVEIDDRHPLASLLMDVTRQRLGLQITLRPLDRRDSGALVGAILDEQPAPQIVDAVYAATEGNAFFMEELLRHFKEQGRDLSDAHLRVGNLAIPEGVRQVIGRRLAHLGSEANQLLAYSSVLGRDLSLAEVAAVTEKDEASLLDLLDAALAARLLVEGSHGYAFAHPLIRETLYQSLSRPRRRQLHRRVGEALERLYDTNLEPHLTELAYHFCQAVQRSDDVSKAIGYATRAGERAVAVAAYEEAADHFQRALQALEFKEPPDEAQRCELLLALGDAQWKAARSAAARETFLRAADIARRLNEPERFAEAALGFGARGMVVGVVDESLLALLEEALAAVGQGDSGLQAMLLARLADEHYFSDHQERRVELAQQAVEMARRVGDPQALIAALGSRRSTMHRPEQVEERARISTEIIQLAQGTNDRLNGHYYLLIDQLEVGNVTEVAAEIEEISRLAEELRHPRHLWNAALARAMRAFLDGQFDDGERLAEEALALGQRAGEPDALLTFGVQLFLLRREQGRLQELEDTLRDFVAGYPAVPAVRSALAYLYGELGREAEGRAEFERLAQDGFSGLPHDAYRVVALILLSELSATLADSERAATLYQLLLPYAGRTGVINCVVCVGSISRSLGLLATVMRRWDEAARHFEDAIETNGRIHGPSWLATARLDYARMLIARGGPDDARNAHEQILQSLSTGRALGMKRLVQQAEALKLQPPAPSTPSDDASYRTQ